jgi:ABC-type bacteriocin/lantibiotic exporter with double-glycine peptidase domain
MNVKQHDISDCGPACMVAILAHWGRLEPIHSLRDLSGTTLSGTSLAGLLRAAKKLECDSKAFEADLDGLRTLELPMVLHWDHRHWVVLWKIGKRGFLIGDPTEGKNVWFSAADLEAHWTGKLLWLKPSVRFERGRFVGKRGLPGLLAHLSHFRGSGGAILEVGAASLALTLLGLVSPILSQVMFDRVLTFREQMLLPSLLIAIFLLSGIQTVFEVSRGLTSSFLAMRLDYRLHLGYLDHLLHLPLRAAETRLPGDLLSRFSDLSKIRAVLLQGMVEVPSSIMALIVSVVLLVIYNPKLALVASLNIPLQLAYLLILSPRLRQISREELRKSAEVSSFVLAGIEGLPALRSARGEDWAFGKGRNLVSGLMDISWRAVSLNSWGSSIFGLLGHLGSLLTLWYGATQVLSMDLSVGQLVAANALTGNALGALSHLTGTVTAFQEGVVASDRLAEVLELPAEHSHGLDLQPLTTALEVEHVRFGFVPERPILRDVNLRLERGSYTALLGSNGSGKSTLTAMLARLLEPDSGRILWDGVPIVDANLETVRDRVFVLRQDVPVFATTLRENLTLGHEHDDARLRELLTNLDITHLERRLPEGFDTQVGGESPHRFSSGERQLIGLARALLSSADLLVLDEPSATLDVDREARVVEVLRGLTDRTVLVVTHRPALLEPADQILVLEEGVVRPRTQIEFEPEVLVPTEASAETVLERRHVQGQLAALAGALALNGVTP